MFFARLHRAFFWGLVLIQLLLPVAYYAGWREPDDERFAWRMFSAVRARSCSVSVVNLTSAGAATEAKPVRGLHASWLHALERGRTAVLARYLQRQCAPGATPFLLERRCRSASGTALRAQWFRFDCAAETLAVADAPERDR